jgi:RimJ/RimL family protein N-acetyltransferase
MTAETEPILTLVGEKVALGPLRRELVPLYQRWMNDFEVTRTIGRPMWPLTREAEEDWYEGAARGEREVTFTAYERASLRPIGNSGLMGIDHQRRVAEFGILIGEKDCWGKGYGTETTRLVLDYAFHGLGLHNVMLRVYAHNLGGIRVYERAGFRLIGRRRDSWRMGDLVRDELYMDCLATEFESPYLRRLHG